MYVMASHRGTALSGLWNYKSRRVWTNVALFFLSLIPMGLSSVTSSPTAAAGQTFDYIVVGAGLTGTTVASRLSEMTNPTVLLVEAGSDNRQDSRVFDFYKYTQAFGTELDWSWQTDGHNNMVR